MARLAGVALYRKYRPASFVEVVGQEHVTVPLSTALNAGRINHAYLFSGPRGCGKTSSARILARSLNCVDGPTATPCGRCPSCVALAPGGPGNLDVIEMDAASHGGVDDTRELRDRAFYAPAQSRYRVFIIDEAHMVTTAGFNALLKIVEEPPEHVVFIFATTEPDKVLATIRSRTHHYPFRLLPPAAMRGLLSGICERESVTVDPAVYPLVIRAGAGSPRDSLSVLDQLLAGAGDDGVTYERASALLGATDVVRIDDAVDALAANNAAALFGVVDAVVEAGHDPRRFAIDLLERMRDLIVLRAVPDAAERGLVDAPGDVVERMVEQAGAIGPATLTRYAEVLHAGLGGMRGATAPRLLLEITVARMLLPAVSDQESAVLQRLERLEHAAPPAAPVPEAMERSGRVSMEAMERSGRASSRRPSEPAAEPRPMVRGAGSLEPPEALAEPSVPATPAPPVEPVEDDQAFRQFEAALPQVRVKVREHSRTIDVMLAGASVVAVDGDVLVLSHDSAPLVSRLTDPRHATVLRTAVREVTGRDVDIRWRVGSDPGGAPQPPPPAAKAGGDDRPRSTPARYTRPSRGGQQAAEDVAPPADIPPPDEPVPPDTGPPSEREEAEMIAAAREPVAEVAAYDPDESALALLHRELGARRID